VSSRAIIVVPVLDEAPSIAGVVTQARRHAPVIVVDDGSRDGSGDVARAAGAAVVRHARRAGKGAALASGIEAARAAGADLVVTLDGDRQHAADDVPRLLEAARTAPGAIVIGSRAHALTTLPRERAHAVRIAGFFLSWVTGATTLDTQSGFRVYPLAAYDAIVPRRGGFVWETEILVRAAARGIDVLEVPVRVIPRATRRSRFRPLGDGTAIAAYLARPVLARWCVEIRAAAGAVGSVFGPEARQPRHAALAAALGHVSLTLWGPTMMRVWGSMVADCLGAWRSHPRWKRATTAAAATLAAPPILGLLAAQSVYAGSGRDHVGALVARLYDAARLSSRHDVGFVEPLPPVESDPVQVSR
jgi:hypothetical protein